MDIHARFESLSLETIREFLEEAKEENLSLEFKTVKHSSLNSSDDKRNLARAISGFANSSGGLIIWGVDARKNEDGVDCVVGLEPISEIDKLLSRLKELEGDAVSPRVEGIEHKTIEVSENEGFAATLIPESISGPHMAKLGENRYYKRSGDSFYLMEHYDIADMFGRRQKPDLEISVRVEGSGSETIIYLGITNKGRGSARAPYIAFTIPEPFKHNPYGLDGNGSFGLPRLLGQGSSSWIVYGGNAQSVIHPDTTYEVTSIFLGLGGSGPVPPSGGVTLEYKITAEDIAMISGTKQIEFT